MLVVVDAYGREGLASRVGRRLGSGARSRRSRPRRPWRAARPERIRSDNGPGFAAAAVRAWLARLGGGTPFIEPGSPREDGYRGSFNGELRDEPRAREIFDGLREAQVLSEAGRRHDDTVRPHSALGYRPPAPEAAPWPGSASAGPLRPTAGHGADVVHH